MTVRFAGLLRVSIVIGIEVVGPIDHTMFRSIYFFDPNGHRLELAVNTGSPDLDRRLDDVKGEMLNEWAEIRRAPEHARWMHEWEGCPRG